MTKVLVLVDHQIGSSNQARSLAKILGFDYEEVKLEYNLLSHLPNGLQTAWLILKSNIIDKLKVTDYDIVISAGRKSAKVAVWLKKLKPAAKLIQVLRPGTSPKAFEAIVLPYHDKLRDLSFYGYKVLRIEGAITHYPKEERDRDLQYWSKKLKIEHKPIIGVLIGGKAKGCNFTENHLGSLIKMIINLAKEQDAFLMLTNSRRTPIEYNQIILEELTRSGIKFFFHNIWNEEENPYKGIINISDHIIVTGDSISMCIESLQVKKPTYVYAPTNMLSAKHNQFVENLLDKKLIHKFEGSFTESQLNTLEENSNLRRKLLEMINHIANPL